MRWSNRGFVLVLLGSVLVVPAAQAQTQAERAPATCAGHDVTISFQDLPSGQNTIQGTSGPDVIQGGPADETIKAGAGDDYVCGGGGRDSIDGGPGRDELYGQDDSDTFVGADLAQDLVTGGSRDRDFARYADLTAGVRVDLSTGLVQSTAGGPVGGVLGVESVRGSDFDDELIGRAGEQALGGGPGNDTIDGRDGSDDLFGGAGTDRVDYTRADSRVQVSLSGGIAILRSTEDNLVEFEDVVGSSHDDRIVGDKGNNHLIGGGGDDTITGGKGDDVLEGGDGDDVLFPSKGDDYVDGGTNDPVTSIGEHGDLVSYQGETLDDDAHGFSAELRVHPFTGGAPFAEGVGDDTLAGIESVRGVKDKTNILIGNDEANLLIGGDRTDLILGRGGNDLIFGLGRHDTMFGDNGPDDPPAPFGDDFIDGGGPDGNAEADHAHGQDGDDTCINVDVGESTGCETPG